MKFNLLTVAVFLVLWTGGAVFAQGYGLNAAQLGRGGVGVGLTSNEQTTYSVNPGALGTYQPWGPGAYSEKPKWESAGEYGFTHDADGLGTWTAAGTARFVGKPWGVGIGYSSLGDENVWTAGFGTQAVTFRNGSTLGVGVGVNIPHSDSGGNTTTWDLGALYTLPKVEVGSIPATFSAGFVARDIFGAEGRTYDLGVGVTARDWRVGVDAWDVSNEFHRSFELGGEYRPIEWGTVRIGVLDHDFTWGLSAHYNGFSLDYAHVASSSDSGTQQEWALRYAVLSR